MLLGETPKADTRCQLLYLYLHYTFTAASKGKCQYSVLQGYNVRNVFRQLFHTPAVPTSTPSPHHTSWTSITTLSVTQNRVTTVLKLPTPIAGLSQAFYSPARDSPMPEVSSTEHCDRKPPWGVWGLDR